MKSTATDAMHNMVHTKARPDCRSKTAGSAANRKPPQPQHDISPSLTSRSERPVFWAGPGCRFGYAWNGLLRALDRGRATTSRSADVDAPRPRHSEEMAIRATRRLLEN